MRAVDKILQNLPHRYTTQDERTIRRHEAAHSQSLAEKGVEWVRVFYDGEYFVISYSDFLTAQQRLDAASAPLILDKRFPQKPSKLDQEEINLNRRRINLGRGFGQPK